MARPKKYPDEPCRTGGGARSPTSTAGAAKPTTARPRCRPTRSSPTFHRCAHGGEDRDRARGGCERRHSGLGSSARDRQTTRRPRRPPRRPARARRSGRQRRSDRRGVSRAVVGAPGPRHTGARAARAPRPRLGRGRLDAGVEDHRRRPADARTMTRPGARAASHRRRTARTVAAVRLAAGQLLSCFFSAAAAENFAARLAAIWIVSPVAGCVPHGRRAR